MSRCPSLSKVQRTIMRIVNASPIVLLVLTFTWSYWAYNFSLCFELLKEGHAFQGLLYVVFYHIIFTLCMWSYWTVCRTSPGFTQDMYKKKDEELMSRDQDAIGLLAHAEHIETEQEEQGLKRSNSIAVLDIDQQTDEPQEYLSSPEQPITVKRDGGRRYCQKCKLEKFDRTHHCRQCGKCVLKMDHHCPWINNCVGFQNYKSFYLFLVYASAYCLFIFSTTLPPTIIQLNGPMSILGLNLNWALLVFISGIFGLFLVPFTLFHTRQLCKNRTTIEYYEKANYRLGGSRSRDIMRSQYFNPWDVGTGKNIEQVLGKHKWGRLLPIGKPLGNGSSFPINTYAYDTLGETDEFGE